MENITLSFQVHQECFEQHRPRPEGGSPVAVLHPLNNQVGCSRINSSIVKINGDYYKAYTWPGELKSTREQLDNLLRKIHDINTNIRKEPERQKTIEDLFNEVRLQTAIQDKDSNSIKISPRKDTLFSNRTCLSNRKEGQEEPVMPLSYQVMPDHVGISTDEIIKPRDSTPHVTSCAQSYKTLEFHSIATRNADLLLEDLSKEDKRGYLSKVRSEGRRERQSAETESTENRGTSRGKYENRPTVFRFCVCESKETQTEVVSECYDADCTPLNAPIGLKESASFIQESAAKINEQVDVQNFVYGCSRVSIHEQDNLNNSLLSMTAKAQNDEGMADTELSHYSSWTEYNLSLSEETRNANKNSVTYCDGDGVEFEMEIERGKSARDIIRSGNIFFLFSKSLVQLFRLISW